ncbi:MAG: hypothetical protein JXA00_04085 [Candidatus Thermoplasmatota archaeon]|nr:hypothetical protein [Candidatus Thermoplasmatota archaeon]
MKKIAIVTICLLLIGVGIAAAAPQQQQQTVPVNPTDGTFDGNVGYKRPGQNATIVGTIAGTYTMKNRGGRFNGDWATENYSGTLKGAFGRHLLIGRISMMINGTERSLPIIGFIGYRDSQFLGRFMSLIGPALYFWGTYT